MLEAACLKYLFNLFILTGSFSSTRAVLSFHAFLSKLFTRAHSAISTIVKRFLCECVQKESLADALRYQIQMMRREIIWLSIFNYVFFVRQHKTRSSHRRDPLFFPSSTEQQTSFAHENERELERLSLSQYIVSLSLSLASTSILLSHKNKPYVSARA